MEQHEIITIEDSPVPEEKRGIKRGRGGEQKSGEMTPGPSSAQPMTPYASPAETPSTGRSTWHYTEMTPSPGPSSSVESQKPISRLLTKGIQHWRSLTMVAKKATIQVLSTVVAVFLCVEAIALPPTDDDGNHGEDLPHVKNDTKPCWPRPIVGSPEPTESPSLPGLLSYCPFSRYCTREARHAFTLQDDEFTPCCSACSCREDCLLHGNCCPDADRVQALTQQLPVSRCKPTVTGNVFQDLPIRPGYYVIETCSQSDPTSDVVRSCLTKRPGNLTEMLFVTDLATHTIYRNHYCAVCNGARTQDIESWELGKVLCTGFSTVYREYVQRPWSVRDVLHYLTEGGCELELVPPETTTTELEDLQCDAFTRVTLVTSCNVTGKWEEYNATLEALCHSYNATYRDTSGYFTVFYGNVYCFLCNNPTPAAVRPVCKRERTVFLLPPPSFSLLVDAGFTVSTEVENSLHETMHENCSANEVFDNYSDECRRLVCPLFQGARYGECVNVIANVFDMSIKQIFVVKSNMPPRTHDEAVLSVLTDYFLSQARYTMFRCEVCNIDIFMANIDNATYLVDVTIQTNQKSCTAPVLVETLRWYYNRTVGLQVFVGFSTSSVNVSLAPGVRASEARLVRASVYRSCSVPTVLPDTFHCPAIEVQSNAARSNLSSDTLVCLERYLAERKQEAAPNIAPVSATSASATSLVSTCVSVASAIAILVTLCILVSVKQLRKNLAQLVLVILANLLLGQVVYLFGMSNAHSSPVFCAVSGACIHFFFLAYVSSLTVYFIWVYTSLRRGIPVQQSANSRRRGIKWILLVYTMPTLAVGINMAVSEMGERSTGILGYGGTLCYISVPLMVGLLFVLPVAICVAVNIVLWSFAVQRLRSASLEINSFGQQQSKNIFICFRLSALTGITWVFGVLYALLGYEALEYIFIVLNGGQGVILMLCFLFRASVKNALRLFFKRPVSGNED